MSSKRVLRFSATEIKWGLEYAHNEHGATLNRVLFSNLANTIRHFMDRPRPRPFEDVRYEILERAFQIEFESGRNPEEIRSEMQIYSSALGKMFNNRKNIREPEFNPTTRTSKPHDRGPKVLEMSDGQLVIKP